MNPHRRGILTLLLILLVPMIAQPTHAQTGTLPGWWCAQVGTWDDATATCTASDQVIGELQISIAPQETLYIASTGGLRLEFMSEFLVAGRVINDGNITLDAISWRRANGLPTYSVPGAEIFNNGTFTIVGDALFTNGGILTNTGALTIEAAFENEGFVSNAGVIINANVLFNYGTIVNTCTGQFFNSGLLEGAEVQNTDCALDTTAPTMTVPDDISVLATSLSGATVAYTASAYDAVDGSLTPTCSQASGSTFAPNITTVTCTASDSAGNTASASFTVTVSFTRNGFYRPIDMEGANRATAGRVVPVKFEVYGAGGMEFTDPAVVASISVVPATGCASVPGVPVEEYAATGGGLRYDTADGHFISNWKTPRTRGCYTLVVTTTDGGSISALFDLR
jgi:hypothetical protein